MLSRASSSTVIPPPPPRGPTQRTTSVSTGTQAQSVATDPLSTLLASYGREGLFQMINERVDALAVATTMAQDE